MRTLALGLVLLAGCHAAPLVAPLNYEPVEAVPEEAFRLAPPDASPVLPEVPLAFHVSTLANGLTVAVLERHAIPMVTMDLVVARGYGDTRVPLDVHEILGELMKLGTARRTEQELAAAYARHGAAQAHWRLPDAVGLGANAGAQDLEPVMGLLAENAMTPRFSEFARARLEMVRDQENVHYDASAMLLRNVARALFGRAHPYGFIKWALPHTESIHAEDIAALHADLFRPAHATLVVVGDAAASDVERMAQRWFGSWAPTPALPRPALPPPAQEPHVILVDRGTGGQTEVAIASRGPSTEKDYLALRLLVQLFGGTSSRLRGQVRVEMGAGYAFGGEATVWRSASQLALYGVFDVAKAPSAVRAMLAAIAEARTRGVRERDLERARTTILAEWRSAALSTQGAAKLAAEAVEVGLPLESLAAFPRLMQSITREDVHRVAQRYLAEDSLHVVVVAEKSEQPKFADLGLGPVELRDPWTEPAQP